MITLYYNRTTFGSRFLFLTWFPFFFLFNFFSMAFLHTLSPWLATWRLCQGLRSMQIAVYSTDLLQCSLKKKKRKLTMASWTLTAVSLSSALVCYLFRATFLQVLLVMVKVMIERPSFCTKATNLKFLQWKYKYSQKYK